MSSLLTVVIALVVLGCAAAFEYDIFPNSQLRLLHTDPRSLSDMEAGGDIGACKTACDGMPACKLFNYNRVKDKCWFKTVKTAGHADLLTQDQDLDIYQKVECDDVILTDDKKMHKSLANYSSNTFMNETTGKYQFVLECGEFTYDTTPPFDVTWTLPDGTQVGSYEYLDGFFRFVLPRDAQEGTYRCAVEAPAWAQSCMWEDSMVHDNTDSSLELMESYLGDEREKSEKNHEELTNKINENKANIQTNTDAIGSCSCVMVQEHEKEIEDLKQDVADLKADRRRR